MKLKPCQLCEGALYDLYLGRVYVLEDQVFDLVRCRNCGLIRVAPMPEPEVVRRLYDDGYFERDFSCGVRAGSYLETESSRVEEYRETLEMIRKYRPGGRFLEVGCAGGSFLNYARRAGFEAEGVDISEWSAKTASEQFGLEVHVGRLVEVGLPADTYDVVFLGDLLEHEPRPVELLTEVGRIVKTHGLVAVKVPTYVNSIYYRTARLFPVSWTLGRLDVKLLQALKLSREGPQLPPYHLYEFSLDSLSRMCTKAGLTVIDHRNSLLVPEFLDEPDKRWPDRVARMGFSTLRFLVRKLNAPAGHVMVFAVSGKA